METLRPDPPNLEEYASARRLLHASFRSLRAMTDVGTVRVAYLKRFKTHLQLPPNMQIEERYYYSRFSEAPPRSEGLNALDALHRAFDDKRLEIGLHVAAKDNVAAQYRPDNPRPRVDTRPEALKPRPLRPTCTTPQGPRQSRRVAPSTGEGRLMV
jgi:hypothetical protein